ncbi:MAG TPA: tyrosine-type recombinase/integrase [Gemmataceae bacterium]|jgi:site-specific recombinase XerD
MFDQLFSRPGAVARHRAGPLLEERLRCLSHLAELGMRRTDLQIMAHYLLVIAQLLRLADRPGEVISRDEIDQKALLWSQQSGPRKIPGARRPRLLFSRFAKFWLRFLGRLQPLPQTPVPFAREIAAYAEYLRDERGLASTTIENRSLILRSFLSRLHTANGSLQEITLEQIDDALAKQITSDGCCRVTVHDRASILRCFFLYVERRGWCRPGLAVAIKGPRTFGHETIPTGPSWEEVRRALAMTNGDRPADIRDHALLLLLAVYGLRASEVVRLRLEDFDWERELFTVRLSKSGRSRTYPLARSVAAAILRYLKEVRPRTVLREVFLARCHAPVRPLHRCTLYLLVSRRLRVVSPALARFGPHALRHACATHLLQEGLSLKEIGDYLGHSNPESTRAYAKVDLTGLRQVADLDLGGLL